MDHQIIRREYVAPQLILKGDIAALTQQLSKQLGAGDGLLFIPGQPPIPIQNLS